MNPLPKFDFDQSDGAQVASHLTACDNFFVPPLRTRISIDEYSRKITEKARRFEAWVDGELVGLVAAYCNDATKYRAYVTSVSVLPQWQSLHIADQLLARCIDHMRGLGFKCIELELDSSNRAAYALYIKHGFQTNRISERRVTMNLVLDLGKEI